MSWQFASQFSKWIVPAGITVGLLGGWVPVGADDVKVPEPKAATIKVEVEGRKVKEEDRKEEPKKEEPRKEEPRKEEPRKEERRKEEGQESKEGRLDELSKLVKQLAGQVNELREEVRGLRSGGLPGSPNPEEMKKRMEEMAKKFGGANPAINPEKMKVEMEKHMQEMAKKLAAANPSVSPEEMREKMEKHLQEMTKKFGALNAPGAGNIEKMREEMEKRFKAEREKISRDVGDPEAQIRREIERLNAELKKIKAAKEGEGGDKVEKKEPKKEGGDKEEKKEDGDKKEGGDKEVKKEGGDKKDGDRKEDKKADDK
ncbi:MAG: hypothetical protein ACKVP0_21750 [Pirellulaceae bacterium]